MNIGQASAETHEELEKQGFKYDPAIGKYVKADQYGTDTVYANEGGNRICRPDSNNWEKFEDSDLKSK